MQIPVWEARTEKYRPPHTIWQDGAEQNSLIESSPSLVPKAIDPLREERGSLDWPQLFEAVSECQRCPQLAGSRQNTVFGVGDQQADLLVIGDVPRAVEDRMGEPFVGESGQLLNLMLRAMGFARQQVYLANILKCSPANNRDPHRDEIAHCLPYLQQQIELLQPKAILVVGCLAAHALLASDEAIEQLRGKVFHYQKKIPLIVTYHPAYLLREPHEKAKSWQDLQLLMRTLSD